jgi:hypothetical protein
MICKYHSFGPELHFGKGNKPALGQFSPDGRFLALTFRQAWGSDSELRCYALPELTAVWKKKVTWIRDMSFSPDGLRLVIWSSGDEPSPVTVVEPSTGHQMTSFKTSGRGFCVIPDNSGLAFWQEDAIRHLDWDGTEMRNVKLPRPVTIRSVAFSLDGAVQVVSHEGLRWGDPDLLAVLNRQGDVLSPDSWRSDSEGRGGEEASGSADAIGPKLRSPVADWLHSLLSAEESERLGSRELLRSFTDLCAQSHHPKYGNELWFYVVRNGRARPMQVLLPERMLGIVSQLGSEGHQVAMIGDSSMVLVHSELAELRAEANSVLDAAEILYHSEDRQHLASREKVVSMLANVVYEQTRAELLSKARSMGVSPPDLGRQQMLPRESSRFVRREQSGCVVL